MASLLLLKATRLRNIFSLIMVKNPLITKNVVRQVRFIKTRNASTRGVASQAKVDEEQEVVQSKYHNFDRAIFQMDMELKRVGRISRNDVDDLFYQVKRTGSISSTQGLMLLRCCGHVLVESRLSERMELLNNILQYLKKKGFVFDVSHYNALLKVYLDNEYEFKPEDIVAEMDKNGVELNRVTYQRLIARFCQMGDTNGASKVLEVMKSKSLPVNENIFNSLIMGHFKTSGMDGVSQVLELMNVSNLEPSEDTYTLLLSCYAKKGDWENMQKVFEELSSKKVGLGDRDYLKIVEVLAENGYSQFIPEVLSMLPKTSGFNQEIYNSTIRLVNNNQVDMAYTLLQLMFKPAPRESEPPSSGNFFIRQLVLTKQPIDKIISICKEMEAKEINSVALSKAIEMTIEQGEHDSLLKYFNVLKAENRPIRPHFFWPILAHHRRMKNKNGILKTLTAFLEYNCKPDLDTFVDYIFPAFDSSVLEDAVMEIKDVGFTLFDTISPLVVYLINNQDLKRALEIITKFQFNYVPSLLIPALSKQAGNMENITDIMKILSVVLSNIEGSAEQIRPDFAGQFLLDSFYHSQQNVDKLKAILTVMVEQSISMSSSTVELLQRRLKESATPEIMALINKLTLNLRQLSTFQDDTDLPPYPRQLSVEDLENHLIELKSKNMNPRGVLRRLFIENCRLKNFNRVQEIKDELDADGFQFSGGMLALLMDMTVNIGDLVNALKIKEEIHSQFPDFIIDDFKLINLAIGMVKEDKLDDAFKIFSQQDRLKGGNSQGNLDRSLSRLLNAISEKGIIPTRNMFELLIKLNYCNPSTLILGPLIKAHLVYNDIPSAIKEFEECILTYRMTPYKTELYKILIELEDTENLQKVIDMTIKIHGEMNNLHDLAIAFLEVGRLKQAKKIFETPGLRAKMDKLIRHCDWWRNNNKIEWVENLVNITKDLFEVDRNAMYMELLRCYRKVENPQKALACWTTMQEENLQPTSEVLQYLASILQEHQITVPFSIPIPKDVKMKDESVDEVNYLIQNNNLIEALKLANELITNQQPLSLNTKSSLVEALLHQDLIYEATSFTQSLLEQNQYPQISVLRLLLAKLSLKGDIKTLQILQTKLPERIFGKIKMNTHIDSALINSGKAEEILQKWENQDEPNNFHRGSVFYLLRMKPETLPRVEKISEKYANGGFYLGTSVLWQYYAMKEQFDKAMDLFKKFPKLPSHLQISNVCREAQRTNKESLLTKLIDILRPLNNSGNLAFAYSYLIGLQCINRHYDEALGTLKKLEEDNLHPEDLQSLTLKMLKKGLEQSGKSLPFQISEQTKKKTIEYESDSDAENAY